MAKVDDLPNDVLRLILGNQLKKLNVRGKCLDLWKNTLPILSVCRRWRHIAKDMVYAHAIIKIEKNQQTMPQRQGLKNYVAPSNVELIEKNDIKHMVRRLYISSQVITGYSLDFLLPAADALVLNIDECPKLAKTGELVNSGRLKYHYYDTGITEHIGVAEEIVDSICRRYFNVNWLEIDIRLHENSCIAHFPDMLINAYAEQLMHVRSYSHSYYPYLNYITQLRTSRIEAYVLDEAVVAPLKPGVLECLWLGSEVSEFFWNDLRYDKRASMVRFDYLKKLVMKNPDPSDIVTLRNTDFNFGFEFPQLSILVLENVKITPGIADCLMCAPLRQLDFTGPPADALLLCSRNTGSLEKLALRIDCKKLGVPNDERAMPVRALFIHMQNITEVQCNIRLGNHNLDISDIDFSNFTHLKLDAAIDLGQFVSKLPTMQKLVRLILNPNGFNAKWMAKTNDAIEQFLETHTTPVLPNISKAKIYLPDVGRSKGFLFSNLFRIIPELDIRCSTPHQSLYNLPSYVYRY